MSFFGNDAPVDAANISAQAQGEALDFQRQVAAQFMDLQQQQQRKAIESELYQRAFQERGFEAGLEQYQDALALQQAQFGTQQQQLDYGNLIRRHALGNLQDFVNAGLGALPGLSAMTGGPNLLNAQPPTPDNPQGHPLNIGPRSVSMLGQFVPTPELQQSLPDSNIGRLSMTYPLLEQEINARLPEYLAQYSPTGPGGQEVYLERQSRMNVLANFLSNASISPDNLNNDQLAAVANYLTGQEDAPTFEELQELLRGD